MKGKDTCNFLVFLPKTDLFKLFCDVSGKKALARFRWICKSVIFCIYYESNLHDKTDCDLKKETYNVPGTGCKLNVRKTFRGRTGRVLDVFCTFKYKLNATFQSLPIWFKHFSILILLLKQR